MYWNIYVTQMYSNNQEIAVIMPGHAVLNHLLYGQKCDSCALDDV